MIHVVAVITCQPGQRAAVIEAIKGNLAAVHAEDGCIEYGPAIDAPGSPAAYGEDTVLVIEKWASPDALMAHSRAPHMTAFRQATKAMIANSAIHILTVP